MDGEDRRLDNPWAYGHKPITEPPDVARQHDDEGAVVPESKDWEQPHLAPEVQFSNEAKEAVNVWIEKYPQYVKKHQRMVRRRRRWFLPNYRSKEEPAFNSRRNQTQFRSILFTHKHNIKHRAFQNKRERDACQKILEIG